MREDQGEHAHMWRVCIHTTQAGAVAAATAALAVVAAPATVATVAVGCP